MNRKASRINGGNSARGRRESDYYPTPPEVTFALLDKLSISPIYTIWEPACGHGHMVRVMERMGYRVIGTDIQSGTDFLTVPLLDCDWIITNPPFVLAEQFVRRCWSHGKPFALLLKTQYWNAAKRYRLFQECHPVRIMPLTWRPDFTGGGGAMMDMAWCVWVPGSKSATIFEPLNKPEIEGVNIYA